MSVLTPLTHALAVVVAAAHAGLTSAGADPSSGLTWVACIAAVVVAVRLSLLPLVAHGVRLAHASARARPQLQALTERYRSRTDRESLRSFAQERARITAEHGVPRGGSLLLLAQVPIWIALYHLMTAAAAGTSVGALSTALVASLGSATLLGVPLAERGYLGTGWTHLAVVAGLATTAAVLSFVTQHYLVASTSVPDGVPDVVARTQQVLPVLSAVGLLVAGGLVPVALLVYWVVNGAWTLGQSAVIRRWFPIPGSPVAGPQP